MAQIVGKTIDDAALAQCFARSLVRDMAFCHSGRVRAAAALGTIFDVLLPEIEQCRARYHARIAAGVDDGGAFFDHALVDILCFWANDADAVAVTPEL